MIDASESIKFLYEMTKKLPPIKVLSSYSSSTEFKIDPILHRPKPEFKIDEIIHQLK
jgi:hypothetical protein